MTSDVIREFEDRLHAAGLVFDHIEADGVLHRVGVTGKENGTDGAYRAHLDAPANVWWRNWVSGDEGRWTAKPDKEMTSAEKKALKKQIAEDKAAAAKEQEERWAMAAEIAKEIWNSAKPAPDNHAYLLRKEVRPFGLRVARDGRLVVPVMDIEGNIQSVQFIAGDGSKRFLTGGKTQGGFFVIPSSGGLGDGGTILVCEGVATGVSLHMATGMSVVVSFNCGNLAAVGKMLRTAFPDRTIIVCADNDITDHNGNPREMNPGVDAATKAAAAIGAKLAICPAINGNSADFNDLHREKSLDIVRQVIEAALKKSDCHMPEGYFLRADGPKAGLYKLETKPDGDSNEIRLGPPLIVKGFTRDADGNAWGLLLEWNDADGRIHRWAMPLRLLNEQGGTWYGELLDGGWRGVSGTRSKLAQFLASIHPEKRIYCVPRVGWHGDAYVLPDAVYGAAEGELVLQSPNYGGLYRQSGTLEQWGDEVAAPAVENTRLSFALCISLSGPLLKLAGLEGGGFSFEGGSSCGKTTCLQLASSVWGDQSHVRPWRSTDNGMEGVAVLHNDNLLILDEIGQASAKVLSEVSYMLANGAGKTRSGKDGSARKSATWRLIFLSSGEIGLADKLNEGGLRARAGQEVRFVGIPVTKEHIQNLHGFPDAGALSNAIKDRVNKFYGVAGRAFLQALIDDLETNRAKMQTALDEVVKVLCPKGADAQVLRVARRFAICAIAGSLAQQSGILPHDFDAAGAVKACFDDWLAARGGAGAQEDTAILAAVRLFIEANGASRFQNLDGPDAVCINRVGFRRSTGTGNEFLVLPESFKSEVVKGYSERRAAKVLLDAGWLRLERGNRLKSRVSLPGMGRQDCYVLSIPEADDTDL